MNRAARAAATLCLLVLTRAGGAQPPSAPAPESAAVRGASAQTRKRLLEIEQKLTAGKHADAADELQRVLDESGNDLIPPEVNQGRPTARWVAHQLLTKLNPDALRAYQDRIDQPAKKLLAQAKDARDLRPLYQLLDRYFVSHPADEALLLLGDVLFERGEFRAAEGAWRRLLPDAGADLVYPNSKADPAQVRARVVLAVAFAGEPARAKTEYEAFKAKHPNASGTLAGKTGRLADTLKAVLDAGPQLAPERPTAAWPTFGGGPERSGRVPGGVPRDWTRPAWSKTISANPLFARPGSETPPARPPFGHPVIANGEAFIADATRVFRFDLRAATAGASYNALLDWNPAANFKTPLPDACASLTAADGRLYARFGPPVVRAPENLPNSGPPERSYLACLRPAPRSIEELWKLAPPEDPKVPAAWEGAPLVVGKRLWAVYAKFEGGRVVHVAAGYDPVGDTAPARPAWVTELCDSALPVSGEGRARQELLTLSGQNLVFCSNTGAVVAVNAATGQRAWSFRYARARKSNFAGDPSPAVAFGGRVFVAPADGEHVYGLDAVTGQLVWESTGTTEGARILGVARGRLIVSVTGPLAGLRGLDLGTGSHRREDGGWVQGSGTLSYGHGLVTDDLILWPSRAGLYFVRPEDGLPAAGRPNPLPSPLPGANAFFGNVAYADGVLVVVTHAQVWVYRAEPKKIVPRPDATPADLFHRLIDRSEGAFAAGDRTACLADLEEIAASGLPPALRAWAAARMVQLSPRGTARDQLPHAVRLALQPSLMAEWVLTSDGVPVTLETFVGRHLGGAAPAASPPAPTNDAPRCVPVLNPESERDHTLKLPAGVSPLPPIASTPGTPRRLFAAGTGKLIAVPLDQSAQTEHTTPELFTHASDLPNGFVAVGPKIVALYSAAREPVWVFRMPVTDRLTDGPLPFRLHHDADPVAPYLSSFRLAGHWLLARLGEFHLIALDLGAPRVAWVLATTGRNGYEPVLFATTPKFRPHFAVAGLFAIAQLSDGRCWFVALGTGRPAPQPILGEDTALVNWPHAPLEITKDQIVLADGAGRVRSVDLAGASGPAIALPLLGAGRVRLVGASAHAKWCFNVDRPEGLTGDPPQVRVFGDGLLLAVRRNHGIELECVATAGGKPVWEEPTFVDADRIDLAGSDADADRVFVPAGNKLRAFARADGAAAWTVALPDGHGTEWVARVGKSCLVVYPVRALPREPVGTVLARLGRSFQREPQFWRLPGLAATLYDAWVDRAVPVLLLDPETGKRVGKFNVPASGPAVTAWFGPDATVFATGDRVVWLK